VSVPKTRVLGTFYCSVRGLGLVSPRPVVSDTYNYLLDKKKKKNFIKESNRLRETHQA